MTYEEYILPEFIDEHFDIPSMIEIGMFKKGMTYQEMANRVCEYFGYDSVFEYAENLKNVQCHISKICAENLECPYCTRPIPEHEVVNIYPKKRHRCKGCKRWIGIVAVMSEYKVIHLPYSKFK